VALLSLPGTLPCLPCFSAADSLSLTLSLTAVFILTEDLTTAAAALKRRRDDAWESAASLPISSRFRCSTAFVDPAADHVG